MMGIFGPDTRIISGMIFEKQGEAGSETEAEGWARAYENKGYKAKVIPNATKRVFEIWVAISEDPRKEQEKQQQK